MIERARWQRAEWTRREWLRAGAFGVLGLSTPQILAAVANAAPLAQARAKNVLLLVEHGGMSQMDTWDPKPDAPSEHRSPFKPISTKVPGIQFSELLPKTAAIADKIAVVRGMFHKIRVDDHPRGMQYMLSGEVPGGPVEMPDMGSVVAYLKGSECRYLPPYIQLPATSEMAHMTRTGFLPPSYGVFKATARDTADPAWKVPNLGLRSGVDENRFKARRGLLKQLDATWDADGNREAKSMTAFFEQADDLLLNPKTLSAFDLAGESDAVKQRYGKGHRGYCYLLGRKLIEANVRFVTIDVRWPKNAETPVGGGNLNWDHHDHIYAKETCELPGATGAGAGRYGIGHWVMTGSLDQAYSTLIQDLDERGLLKETLVCMVTEFGRTPKINKAMGRDHWTHAYSIVFAGAGVRGGQVIGETDNEAGYVVDNGYAPEDYAATIYDFLGVNREQPLFTPENRPIFVAKKGELIKELVS